MSDDIVTRLREDCDTVCKYATRNEFTACDKCEAADEIERLRKLVVLCPKCYEAEHGVGRWEQVVRGE